MSDDTDILTGQLANEARAGYEPMAADPRLPQEDDDKETHGSDRDSMIKASNELHASRSQEREPLIERNYVTLGGEDHGSPRPANETVTAERAADDLARQRASEVDAIEAQEDRAIADAVDGAKNIPTQEQQEEALLKWHQEQLAAQQAAEAQQSQRPQGMDEDLYKALSNPKVQQALQAEIEQIQAARKSYAEGAFRSAQIAAASLVASVPELQGIAPEQMNVALQLIEKQSPEKAQAIRQHLGKIEYLFNVAQQAKAEQAKLEDQKSMAQWTAWQNAESAKWNAFAAKPETASRLKTVMPQAESLFAEYGLGRQELQHLLKTQPLLNSAVGQQIVLDALSYRQAQRSAFQATPKPPVPAQRPGVAPPSYRADDGEVAQARSEFLSNPSPRSAARMIAARRRAS